MSMSAPDLTAWEEKAFSFAQETVKQMIALSTGIFTITLTFLKNEVPKGTNTDLLQYAWSCYIVSVLFGLLTMMALTGVLGKRTGGINSPGVRVFAGLQAVTFFVGLVLTLLFGGRVA